MILDVDIGNSRIKWRLCGAADVAGTAALDQLSQLALALAPYDDIEQVRASCVAGAPAENAFSQWCQSEFAVLPRYARVLPRHCGVTVGYQQPEKLGVDRWLAILAAFQATRAASVVIDAGSALTVDYVDKAGAHRGGLILPGCRLMAQSLSCTSAIQLQDLQVPPNWRVGQDTLSCVENGVAAMLAGLVDQVIRYGEDSFGKDVSFLVCGGDADSVVCRDHRLTLRADLVLDGLPLALDSPHSV